MDYDVVIATRNRPSALGMSLPLICAQTVKPKKIIVVDASDDATSVSSAVDQIIAPTQIAYEILHSAPSSARQRNLGLMRVNSPVVMLPDDDSLWYPDTAAETLRVYALDTDGVVAGVTANPTSVSPLVAKHESYEKNQRRILKSLLQPLRDKLEDTLFEPPFRRFPRDLWKHRAIPAWVDGKQSELVEYITGFRMSFRTDALRQARFDEVLGYRSGYAQFEDTEVSLRLQKEGGLLVSAAASRVFHHVFPSRRASGFDYGFINISNYLYICCKLMEKGSPAWRQLDRYIYYKMQVYHAGRDRYSREVYQGAMSVWKRRKELTNAPRSELEASFKHLCDTTSA